MRTRAFSTRALCGRRSEGTAFASYAAGRWRPFTSWHSEKRPKNADCGQLSPVLECARRVRVPFGVFSPHPSACWTPCDVFAGPYRACLRIAGLRAAPEILQNANEHAAFEAQETRRRDVEDARRARRAGDEDLRVVLFQGRSSYRSLRSFTCVWSPHLFVSSCLARSASWSSRSKRACRPAPMAQA